MIVTRDNPALPEGCSPAEVAHLIMGFLDAYNRGDREQLADFFPSAFEWYSDTIVDSAEDDHKRHFVTRPGSRNELLDYVTERRQHNDRLQLVKVNVSPRGLRGADIAFQLTREAGDVQPGTNGRKRYVQGKGTIFCRSQKFMVWSMGTASPDISTADLSQVCPDPSSGSPENVVIACARG